MDVRVTDKKLVAQRFARSTPTYNDAAVVQRDMARRVVQLLQENVHDDHLEAVLELGCGTGLLTELLVDRFAIRRLTLNDLVPDMPAVTRHCLRKHPELNVVVCSGDMEKISLPGNQDVVVSNAVLQWAAQPLRMLDKMLDAVRPDGLLGLATFGPSNMRETVDLTGRSLHYLSVDAIRSRLQPRAELLACQEHVATVPFASAFAVLQHLKQTGVNGLQSQTWSPRKLREFCQLYESRFRVGDEVPLTYHPIVIVARRCGA